MAFAYAEQASWGPRKIVALLVAIGVNLGFLAAMQAGLVFEGFQPPKELMFVPVEPEPVPPMPEPVHRPQLDQPVIYVPDRPPDLHIPVIEDELLPIPEAIAGESSGEGPVVGTPTEPEFTQLQVAGKLTPPEYPASAIRRAQQGTVRLLIYVLPDGRVGDVKVDRSSGFPLLDRAAMAAARRYWTFKPAAQGGAPVASWGYFAVTFALKD